MKPTAGVLFAGVGAACLGLQRAGFEIVYQCEIDPFCRSVLDVRFPNSQKYKDIKHVKNAPTTDIIFGSPPCQPYSQAGKQRGNSDDRALWPEMRRIVEESRPAWVILENVAGICKLVQFPEIFGMGSERDCELQDGILRRSDTMSSHLLYRLAPLTPRTGETGSGLLPTPRAGMNGQVCPNRVNDPNRNLETAVARDLFPTPTARDYRSGKASKKTMERNSRPLNEVVVALEPTPTASMATIGDYEQARYSGGKRPKYQSVNSGHLNPDWIECQTPKFQDSRARKRSRSADRRADRQDDHSLLIRKYPCKVLVSEALHIFLHFSSLFVKNRLTSCESWFIF